ncbi:MAG TPA: GWxTD domain-containing protein, partial [Acidobacteriota bacterium]|nr:GWxTD domain-containing protein [Acidobacteriota bacterium]
MTRIRTLCVLVTGILVGINALSETRYERWVDQEVNWIIGKDEKKRFKALTSDEERDQFIEQFWLDRDPSGGTPENQYKEEHYLRLKYANEHLSEGSVPGWRTDRGRIYIIHGAPASRRFEQDFEYWGYPGNPYADYYKGSLTLVFERGGSTFQQRAISESRQGQAQLEIYNRGARNSDVMTSASPRFRLVR